MLRINEIFYSLQGETIFSGLPSIFIRLQGCNLSCKYCDTSHSQDPDKGSLYSIDEILHEIDKFPEPHHITITGGEPLLQKESIDLMKAIHETGAIIQIETNGSMPLDSIPPGIRKITDVKTPSTGHDNSFYMKNISFMSPQDEYKFVISDNNDLLFAEDFIQQNLLNTESLINFSPAFGSAMTPQHLASVIIQKGLSVRLNLQLHRLLDFQ